MTDPIDILDIRLERLADWFTERDMPPYRASQVFKWVYLRQVDDFDRMTDLSKPLRRELAGQFTVRRLALDASERSSDGTVKFRFRLTDGNCIESVLIPERGHETLCVSSQVGCALGCRFCLTGSGGFVRNLTQGEIVAQIRDVRQRMTAPDTLTNIVFMGMGEPLANYDNLIRALDILLDNDNGLKFSKTRVTVSTAGLVPRIADLGRDGRANLAISLNATENRTRDRLMPINRTYPIESLLEACRQYPLPKGRRITFEYIMLRGVNDTEADARRLADLLRPIRSKINLIPFNPHDGCRFEAPDEAALLEFQKILIERHYTTIIRRSKGRDISAACGQLIGDRYRAG